jgi:6-phosphogluconate dehydrogenase-like protein
MEIGYIGLGKMGGNMVERLLGDGHELVVYDFNKDAIDKAVGKGAVGSADINDLAGKLPDRKVVWLMVPSGDPVDQSINNLSEIIGKGDIIIDGGNSNWHDTQKNRCKKIGARHLFFSCKPCIYRCLCDVVNAKYYSCGISVCVSLQPIDLDLGERENDLMVAPGLFQQPHCHLFICNS